MELIDIIKSSLLLFSSLLLLLIIVSFGLFKIRNQAKRKKTAETGSLSTKYFQKKNLDNEFIDKQQTKANNRANYKKPLSEMNEEKYVVINHKMGSLSHKGMKIDYHPNIYKFYEEINSDAMFKIKPKTKIDS